VIFLRNRRHANEHFRIVRFGLSQTFVRIVIVWLNFKLAVWFVILYVTCFKFFSGLKSKGAHHRRSVQAPPPPKPCYVTGAYAKWSRKLRQRMMWLEWLAAYALPLFHFPIFSTILSDQLSQYLPDRSSPHLQGFFVIIMQRLTRHVSVIRMTNRSRNYGGTMAVCERSEVVFRSAEGCCHGNQLCGQIQSQSIELGSRSMAAYDKKCKCCAGKPINRPIIND